MPKFRSHREARLWFKVKYGDAFEIDDSFVVRDGSVFDFEHAAQSAGLDMGMLEAIDCVNEWIDEISRCGE